MKWEKNSTNEIEVWIDSWWDVIYDTNSLFVVLKEEGIDPYKIEKLIFNIPKSD